MVCSYAAFVLLLETSHFAVGYLIDEGRHSLTAQAILRGTILLAGRPVSILIGGVTAAVQRTAER
jgi:hypothetical protein